MPFLDSIVDGLNGQLKNGLSSITHHGKVKAHGISESILDVDIDEQGRQRTKRYPATVDNDGEARMITPDDCFHVVLYHKLESIANTLIPNQGFGDDTGEPQETANMALIVFAFRDKIRKPANWLEALIKDSIPFNTQVTGTGGNTLQKSSFRVGNSSFDKLAILSREYTGQEVSINQPQIIIFETKYQIISSYQKGCFKSCSK